MTLGEKIQKLRKQRGLSQEALAEKVTVTRQTISKWELGQSTPDLDFIAQLSDIFNVSSDYLIKDEMIEPDELLYKKRSYHLSERGKRIILVVVSAAALIAGCVCLICDYFTSDRLSWSLIAVASIIAAWLMLLPSLISRTKIVLKTLVVVSVIPFPLLAILSLLLKRSVIFTLGVSIMNYLSSGNVGLLSMASGGSLYLKALLIAIITLILMGSLSGLMMQKKDI